MNLISLGRAAAVAILLTAPGATLAQPKAPAPSLAEFLKPFLVLPADSGGAWDDLEKHPAVRWAGQGPTDSNRPSPDGNYFARVGQGGLAGRPLQVVATGARSMVFSIYLRDPASLTDVGTVVAGLRQAGFAVAPARCAIDPRNGVTRGYYRITLPRKKPAFLFAGAVPAGGSGYTLYLDQLPLMTPAEAALYTDNCGAPGGPATASARPASGAGAVTALIEAILRPQGSAPSMPWSAVSGLPSVSFSGAPMKMGNPYSDPGEDKNPKLLGGEFKTATTRMNAVVTGDDRTANRFAFFEGKNLTRGAVFDGLMRDGYSITAIRCGKVYTEMSQAWFRISGPGKQPAILYRAYHSGGGVMTEDYAVRLDNVLPPPLPGQGNPVGGRCPG